MYQHQVDPREAARARIDALLCPWCNHWAADCPCRRPAFARKIRHDAQRHAEWLDNRWRRRSP